MPSLYMFRTPPTHTYHTPHTVFMHAQPRRVSAILNTQHVSPNSFAHQNFVPRSRACSRALDLSRGLSYPIPLSVLATCPLHTLAVFYTHVGLFSNSFFTGKGDGVGEHVGHGFKRYKQCRNSDSTVLFDKERDDGGGRGECFAACYAYGVEHGYNAGDGNTCCDFKK